jgi:hypothetical protein
VHASVTVHASMTVHASVTVHASMTVHASVTAPAATGPSPAIEKDALGREVDVTGGRALVCLLR